MPTKSRIQVGFLGTRLAAFHTPWGWSVDDYLGHLREFRRILRNLEGQATHPLNRETLLALSRKLDRDESALNADRLERSIRATVDATATLEELAHYEQDVLSVFHEITARKRHELERDRFRKLLDQSGDSVLIVEPHGGRFLDANHTACRSLGYSREELLELSLNHIEVGLALTPAGAWSDWVDNLRRAPDALYLEGVHRKKDGTRFPVEMSAVAAMVDGQELLLLVARNISERKRSEVRLRRQWAFFSRLVHRSLDGIVAFDRSFHITYWNPALERLLGERKARVLGKNALEVLPQLKDIGEDRYLREALAGTTVTSRNRPYTHAQTAQQVFFDAHYFPLTEETGEILGGIGIIRDVTERREGQLRQTREATARFDRERLAQLELQRQLEGEILELKKENERLSLAGRQSIEQREESLRAERSEGLELLASGLAREVEPLMTGILSQTGVALAELPADSPLRKGVEEIEEAALSANSLASTLSCFSGNGGAEGHRLVLQDLLSELEHSLRSAASPGVEVEITPSSEPVAIARGDFQKLTELLFALVRNASESMQSGRGTVRIETGTADVDASVLARAQLGSRLSPGRYAYLEVSDEGSGMDEETLSKIFVPFFTTRPRHRGLGLATVLGVVRAHGGAIVVDSRLSGGSRFRVLLPLP